MHSLRRFIARIWPALALALLLLGLLLLAEIIAEPVLDRVVTEALIYVVLVVGLYIFIGNSGVLSFGHVGFMLIGAYASAWQTCCHALKPTFMPGLPPFLLAADVPVFPAAVSAGLLASGFAFVIGLPLMRMSGISASIALFGVLAVLKSVYENWDAWTAGTGSIIGLPMYIDARVALAWAIATVFAAYAFQESKFGLALRASREDAVSAKASGVNVFVVRLIALVISAFFVAIAGVLYGHYLGTISVDTFWLDMTFISLAMLVIGGSRSLAGAVIGVISVTTLIELLRRVQEGVTLGGTTISAPDGLQQIALAVIMILILIFRPQGLMGGREILWPFRDAKEGRMDAAAAVDDGSDRHERAVVQH